MPGSLVMVVEAAPVTASWASTRACGMTAPAGSETVPEMLAVVDCANAGASTDRAYKANAAHVRETIGSASPIKIWGLCFLVCYHAPQGKMLRLSVQYRWSSPMPLGRLLISVGE